jgi:hypothetical protein
MALLPPKYGESELLTRSTLAALRAGARHSQIQFLFLACTLAVIGVDLLPAKFEKLVSPSITVYQLISIPPVCQNTVFAEFVATS